MRSPWIISGALALAACGGAAERPVEPPKSVPLSYATDAQWLCLPGRKDACSFDLTTTVVLADGTRRVEADVAPATSPKVDCFYVYPTVDLDLLPGNHTDFKDTSSMGDVALAQIARFRSSCAIYAPLYRQVTIGTYVAGGDSLEPRLALAFADVEAAFLTYLQQHPGRPFVLVGHSQGAEMVRRLLVKHVEPNPELKKRLVVAMPIGGWIGTSATPTCASPDELGCLIAYRSFEEGAPINLDKNKPAHGEQNVCVSPAFGPKLGSAYFTLNKRTRRHIKGTDDITTPWVAYPKLYAAHCVDGGEGFHYLSVSESKEPNDVRVSPIKLADVPFRRVLGLHILDFQLAQGDLVEQLARRVAILSAR